MTIDVRAPDGSVVRFPDGTAPEIMTKAMQAKFGGPKSSALGDVAMDAVKTAGKGVYDYANQFRTGLIEGVGGLAGLPRTAFDLTAAANRYVGGKVESGLGVEKGTLVDPMQRVGKLLNPLSYFPTAQQTTGAIKDVVNTATAPLDIATAEDPKNFPQKLTRYTGEAIGAAPVPSMLPVNLGVGAGGTIGETAGPAIGLSPQTGKTVGGLVGGATVAVPQMLRSTPGEMISRRTQNMTPVDWETAANRQNLARTQGTPLLGPEATDNPALHRLASDTAASAGGGPRMERFLSQRVPQARAATEGALNTVGPAQVPEDVARRLQVAATDVIRQAERNRSQVTRPFYENAADTRLPQSSVDALTTQIDDLTRNAPQEVAQRLAQLRANIVANPTVGAVSGEVKLLRDATRADAFGASVAEKATAARATPIVRAAEAEMESVSPLYQTGQNIYRRMSPRVQQLTEGDVGRLANPNPQEIAQVGSKLSQQMSVIASPESARPGTIRGLSLELSNVPGGSQAFRDATRTYLETAFDKAFKDIQPGANRMAPVNYRNQILGTQIQRDNVRALLEESARLNGQNPNGIYAGFNNLMETFSRMGKVPGIGSPTGGRLESFREAAQGGVTANVLDMARPVDPLNVARRWWHDTIQRQNFAELADVFTAPNSVEIMRQMAVTAPGTARANALAVQLITAGRGAQERGSNENP